MYIYVHQAIRGHEQNKHISGQILDASTASTYSIVHGGVLHAEHLSFARTGSICEPTNPEQLPD